MVGCWFTGQGKKGDCVGKKVNNGPVTIAKCYQGAPIITIRSLTILTILNTQASGMYELSCSVCVRCSSTDQRTPTITEQCRDPTTLIVGTSLAAIVAVLLVIIVVVVVVTCYCCHRGYRKDKALENNRDNHEMIRQWSSERVNQLLNQFREQYDQTDNSELKLEFIRQQRELTSELLKIGSVQADGEEDGNEDIEKERNDEVLILLQDILKRGERNSSLKVNMLKTIKDKLGSELE